MKLNHVIPLLKIIPRLPIFTWHEKQCLHKNLHEGPPFTLISYLLLFPSWPLSFSHTGQALTLRSFFIVFFYFPSRPSQSHIWMKPTLGSQSKITDPLLHNALPNFQPCCSIFLLSLGNGSFLTFPALYLVTFPASLSLTRRQSTPCSGVLVYSLVYLKHRDRCHECSKHFNTHCLTNKKERQTSIYALSVDNKKAIILRQKSDGF